MNILHIASHLRPGGVTSSVTTLACGMAQRGHAVTVAAGPGPQEAALAACGVRRWEEPLDTSAEFGWRAWRGGTRLIRRLRRERIEILHAHTRVGQVVAARMAAQLGLPYVTTWHGFFRPNLGRRLWPCTGRATIAISEPVRRHLRETFRVPAGQIRLIPHGIETDRFAAPADPAACAALRAQVGLPPRARAIGTVARLVASKGVDQLIRALPELHRRVPEVHAVLVGDGPERDRLRRLAAACGVASFVHVTGALPDTRAALALLEAFVFLPADEEGFGLSLLEALASGVPVVAVRRGTGANWLLDQLPVCRLVEPHQPRALAEALQAWLADAAAARREGERGRALVAERFALPRMLDAVEAVYQECVMDGPGRCAAGDR